MEKRKVYLVYTESTIPNHGGTRVYWTYGFDDQSGKIVLKKQMQNRDELEKFLVDPPKNWIETLDEKLGAGSYEFDKSFKTMGQLMKVRPDLREKNHNGI